MGAYLVCTTTAASKPSHVSRGRWLRCSEKMTLGRSLPGGTAEAKTSFSISQNQSRPCNGAT